MTIEVRTYEGSAAEAAAFTSSIWRQTYAGRIPVLEWDETYYEWQLLPDSGGSRDWLVGAYDGKSLVGSLFADPFPFRLHGEDVLGSMSSWLTVDPSCRGRGIASRLADEQRRRHLERGAVFCLGFGAPGTGGPGFWGGLQDTQQLGKIGFWTRVLDARATADWSLSLAERVATRALGLLQGPPEGATAAGIRPYRPGDLPACLELAHGLLEVSEIGYVWTAERLARQLAHRDVPRTLVAEVDGRVRGFVNWYLLGMTGRRTVRAGVIDVLALRSLERPLRRALLDAALASMAGEGAAFAFVLSLACHPRRDLLASGFVPVPGASDLLFVFTRRPMTLRDPRNLLVHWR